MVASALCAAARLESGRAVRGTNSRGAKDVCALGHVTLEVESRRAIHEATLLPIAPALVLPAETLSD